MQWLSSRAALSVIVLVGVGLRAWSYLPGTSLWLDEILLARNIIELPMRELLFSPLALDQVAPRGFLFLEKLAVMVFGPSELSLRLWPFLSSIAGLILFRRLADKVLAGVAVAIAVMLFAIGVPFLRYAAEVKQYHFDATAAILLMVLAVGLVDANPADRRRYVLTGLAGVAIVLFSQASVIVMAGIGAALTFAWLVLRPPSLKAAVFLTVPLWALGSLVGIAMGKASMTPATKAFMDDFWATGFAPLTSASALAHWLWERIVSLFGEPTLLRYPWPAIFVGIAAIGLIALWRKNRVSLLIVIAPVAMAVVAAIAHQYPFRQRLAFFVVAPALILVAEGTAWISRSLARRQAVLGIVPVALCLVPPVLALARTLPPYDIEHSRAMLRYVQEHRQPGDAIYVFPLSRMGVLFYGPQFGIGPHEFVTSVCERDDTRGYLRDADQFRGRPRVWVLTSGARPYRTARPSLRQYLEAIGVHRDTYAKPSLQFGEVTADLFDLSDPQGLTRASADTFPVLPMPTDPRPGCRPWIRPDFFGLR
jgi:hypothetical protein